MGEAVAPREALALAEELEPYLVGVVSKRELWKPWANDPESFERAVLADLEQSVGGHTPELMRELGREFRGARLDGSYPNTEIVVNYLDLNTGNVKETRFPVWSGVEGGMGTPHPQGEL